ncbi:DUF2262 domain-containing protein [Coraliomargarita sp. SDUM461003]|uniref:DUF2262 domain-containing protein n=1 Tax=Thalassobacterium maritimum TaxID=3041265 RepID=A0ABU1B049_9BACT|nr:DUF2262 domain-containing protein [Coraliomargarita sp. SDUM461003]MDQ8209771.1 DUF2262 domain-containing protein [Coraliomargarita sp. SDUM461003]
MNHPILGKINSLQSDSGSFEAIISYEGKEIPVQLEIDDRTLDETIELAANLIGELKKFDDQSKSIIVKDLLETYNDNWRSYDEKQSDGSFETVTNPELLQDEFKDYFTLSEITVTGNEGIDIWYEDTGLFMGHGIFVQSLDGLDFSEAEAQLFG